MHVVNMIARHARALVTDDHGGKITSTVARMTRGFLEVRDCAIWTQSTKICARGAPTPVWARDTLSSTQVCARLTVTGTHGAAAINGIVIITHALVCINPGCSKGKTLVSSHATCLSKVGNRLVATTRGAFCRIGLTPRAIGACSTFTTITMLPCRAHCTATFVVVGGHKNIPADADGAITAIGHSRAATTLLSNELTYPCCLTLGLIRIL